MRRVAALAHGLFGVMCAALICATLTPAAAQVNIEKLRQVEEETGWTVSAGLNFINRTGNVDLQLFEGQLRTDYVRKTSRTFLVARGNLGVKDKETFSDAALFHLRHKRKTTNLVHPEVFGQFDYDHARRLDRRALAGGGIRFSIHETEHAQAVFGTSYMYEHEEYDLLPGDSHPERIDTSRWSNYVTLRWSREGDEVNFAWTTYGQPRFDKFADVRVLSEAVLASDVTKQLALAVTFRLRYDSRPPAGVERTDTFVLVGLLLEF